MHPVIRLLANALAPGIILSPIFNLAAVYPLGHFL